MLLTLHGALNDNLTSMLIMIKCLLILAISLDLATFFFKAVE